MEAANDPSQEGASKPGAMTRHAHVTCGALMSVGGRGERDHRRRVRSPLLGGRFLSIFISFDFYF